MKELQDITKALMSVTQVLHRQGKQRRKGNSSPSVYYRQHYYNISDAVFRVIPEALDKATGGGQYRVSLRTLYYQVRPLFLIGVEDERELTYPYFSQLITRYRQEIRDIPELYYEPTGILHTPHAGAADLVGDQLLGTLEVEKYIFPDHVFNKILYVEKKGLWPILEGAHFHNRYDMAIITSMGNATEAVRDFLKEAEGKDYQLFVLHDADPDGYNIGHTLREATERMPWHNCNVVDIGLTVKEGLERGLDSEPFARKRAIPWRTEEKLTLKEREYFLNRKERIELNAFTAPELVKYIEDKLAEAGAVGKVIPSDEILLDSATDIYSEKVSNFVAAEVDTLLSVQDIKDAIVEEFIAGIDLEGSRAWISDAFGNDDSLWWKTAISNKLSGLIGEMKPDIRDAVVSELMEKVQEMEGK